MSPSGLTEPVTEQVDDYIRLFVAPRTWRTAAGESVLCPVRVINAGPRATTFRLQVTGELNPDWVAVKPEFLPLQPGEEGAILVIITPPADPQSLPGVYPLGVTVSASDYAPRFSHLSAALTVQPFSRFEMGSVLPPHLSLRWSHPQANLVLPLRNTGNTPLTLQLRGWDSQARCRFFFATPAMGDAGGRITARLQPGQTIQVPVRVQVNRLTRLFLPYRGRYTFVAQPVDKAGAVAGPGVKGDGSLRSHPLLGGEWLATFAGLGILGMALILLLLVVMKIGAGVINSSSAQATQSLQQTVAVRPIQWVAPAQISVNPSTHDPLTDVTGQDPPLPSAPSSPLSTQSDPGIEGSDAPDFPGAAHPLAATEPATGGPRQMTYVEMFQEIGSSYGLPWQMLAAQSYTESRLDPQALGSQNDMGLMQIVPPTWEEWAPRIGVSDPLDPYSNVQVGAAYLVYLQESLARRGYPSQPWALLAYNWGLQNVLQVLDSGRGWSAVPRRQQRYVTEIISLANSLSQRP